MSFHIRNQSKEKSVQFDLSTSEIYSKSRIRNYVHWDSSRENKKSSFNAQKTTLLPAAFIPLILLYGQRDYKFFRSEKQVWQTLIGFHTSLFRQKNMDFESKLTNYLNWCHKDLKVHTLSSRNTKHPKFRSCFFLILRLTNFRSEQDWTCCSFLRCQ